MKPENAKNKFLDYIKKFATPVRNLTVAQGVRLMLDFYRDIRVDGCELDEEGDMLLFQWGTYDFGDGESFHYDVTRQFVLADAKGDDDISQLSFTFYFKPSPELDRLGNGDQWCDTPDDLKEFESFIFGTAAYGAIATACPARITIEYGGV